MQQNLDAKTVEGFGDEWERFDQSELSPEELALMFENYFSIFPWDKLQPDAVGFDLGCGSGRWAKLVTPRAGTLLKTLRIVPGRLSLSQNRDSNFYTMRTDALDRFGTRLEKRFTKAEIKAMMERCGLSHVVFSERSFWTAVGFKS